MAGEEDERSAYEILSVPNDASDGDIKSAYRKQSLKVHPDRVSIFDTC